MLRSGRDLTLIKPGCVTESRYPSNPSPALTLLAQPERRVDLPAA